MNATETLKSQLAQLSAQDRAELAQFLIGSLDETTDDHPEAAWKAELLKRAEEITNGCTEGIPADEVFGRLREKYG